MQTNKPKEIKVGVNKPYRIGDPHVEPGVISRSPYPNRAERRRKSRQKIGN